jgi:hypothetical protein
MCCWGLRTPVRGIENRVILTIARFGKTAVIVLGVPFSAVSYAAGGAMSIIRQPRLRRASPAMLQRKLEDGDKGAIFDLLDYEAQAM